MNIVQTSILTLEQKQSLFELWNSEYPERICYKDLQEFEKYLADLSNLKHYLLIDNLKQLMGWAFTFQSEDEDWFGIIIDSKIQGKVFGMFLIDELKKDNLVLNGWVTDHQNYFKRNKKQYLSPLAFHTKCGFVVNENIRLENEKLSAVKIRWERT